MMHACRADVVSRVALRVCVSRAFHTASPIVRGTWRNLEYGILPSTSTPSNSYCTSLTSTKTPSSPVLLSKLVPNQNLSTTPGKVDEVNAIEATAQTYYDDQNALNFMKQVRGDTIHIGRYDLLKGEDAKLEGKARIQRASELATKDLLRMAFPADGPPPSECIMMDMGSSYGDLAREAVKIYGCKVVCIDLSVGFNKVNADRSAAAGMADKIIIPGERSYFATEEPASSVDTVVSQDSFMHASTEHHRAIKEAARVLKPGGIMAFTDMMRSDTADPQKLAEVFEAVQIIGLGSPESYKAWAKDYGLEFVKFDDRTENFGIHFATNVDVINSMRGKIEGVEDRFMVKMATRYSAWVDAANNGLLACGGLIFRKPAE